MLSTYSGVVGIIDNSFRLLHELISVTKRRSQVNSFEMDERAIYSDSADESATIGCRRLFQAIAMLLIVKNGASS